MTMNGHHVYNDPVISCEEEEEDQDEEDVSLIDDFQSGEVAVNDMDHETCGGSHQEKDLDDDLLYDQHADEEDEAYMYQSMQGGRNSDAILQCPCCFQTVCMDCQQHTEYKHIFRAMFVTGITVAWDRPLLYNPISHCLEEEEPHDSVQQQPNSITQPRSIPEDSYYSGTTSMDSDGDDNDDDDEHKVYYTVQCASCETVVAALDMKEEIYHFSHCLATASLPMMKVSKDVLLV